LFGKRIIALNKLFILLKDVEII